MTEQKSLSGALPAVGGVSGSLQGSGKLSGSVSKPRSGEFLPEYDGEYEITPDWEEQLLPTKNRKMRDDVTVKQIPIYEVSNASGGTTVTIGAITEV